MAFDSDEHHMPQSIPPAKTPSRFRRVIPAPVAAVLLIAMSAAVFTFVHSQHTKNKNTTPATQSHPLASCQVASSPASTFSAGKTLSLPQGESIGSAAITSQGDTWAVGGIDTPLQDGTYSHVALILHLEGDKWVSVCDHVFQGVDLGPIAAFSPTDIWAAGSRYGAIPPTPLPLTPTPEFGLSAPTFPVFLHFDSTRWAEVARGS